MSSIWSHAPFTFLFLCHKQSRLVYLVYFKFKKKIWELFFSEYGTYNDLWHWVTYIEYNATDYNYYNYSAPLAQSWKIFCLTQSSSSSLQVFSGPAGVLCHLQGKAERQTRFKPATIGMPYQRANHKCQRVPSTAQFFRPSGCSRPLGGLEHLHFWACTGSCSRPLASSRSP